MKVSRISKVAGAGLIGFCAVALAADKANTGQALSQAAGFIGAFVGSLVASRRPPGLTGRNKAAPGSDDSRSAKQKDPMM